MDSKKVVFLFTSAYPFGEAESFLENEVYYLSKHFQKVYIVPENDTGIKRSMPSNFELLTIKIDNTVYLKKALYQFGLKAIRILLQEIFKSNKTEQKWYLKSLKIRFLDLLVEIQRGNSLYEQLKRINGNRKLLIYSYWFRKHSSNLLWINNCKKKLKFVTRIHGYDYRVEENVKGIFPFRRLEIKKADAVCAVSDYGKNYLITNFNCPANKIKTYRLGVHSRKEIPIKSTNEFRIVSCSYVVPRKRVNLILEALCLNDLNEISIEWIHFGSGESLRELQDLAAGYQRLNVKVNWMGSVKNDEIINYYKKNYVDLFVHASIAEGGCSVSIQEALSFGIPVIAPINTGTTEIMELGGGVGIEENNFNAKNLAVAINKYINQNDKEILNLRNKAFEIWLKYFNAEKNYTKFIDEVLCVE
ncbi:MAG: colanic acid/amylovoran biosynthesis glycosyltransferase [bacterium]|jgi:colanic acid/amylovoran biosynthesis glycosyltransferase